MAIQDKIRDEKLQYHINREGAKISTLSSAKTDKYEYFTGKRILRIDQSRIIKQPKFTYFLLETPLEKQTKRTENIVNRNNRCFESSKT